MTSRNKLSGDEDVLNVTPFANRFALGKLVNVVVMVPGALQFGLVQRMFPWVGVAGAIAAVVMLTQQFRFLWGCDSVLRRAVVFSWAIQVPGVILAELLDAQWPSVAALLISTALPLAMISWKAEFARKHNIPERS